MSEANAKPETRVDKRAAKGEGEGGFSPHPDHKDGFQDEDRSKEQTRQVTLVGKARSK